MTLVALVRDGQEWKVFMRIKPKDKKKHTELFVLLFLLRKTQTQIVQKTTKGDPARSTPQGPQPPLISLGHSLDLGSTALKYFLDGQRLTPTSGYTSISAGKNIGPHRGWTFSLIFILMLHVTWN